jgi:hypothetical protein
MDAWVAIPPRSLTSIDVEQRRLTAVEGFGEMLPNDPIAAPQRRLQFGVGEPTPRVTLEIPASIEPGRRTGMYLEVAGLERSAHEEHATPDGVAPIAGCGRHYDSGPKW